MYLKSAHIAVIAAAAVVVVVRNLVTDKLCYRDFVWFLISEEDKRHPRRSVAVSGCVCLTLHYLEKMCSHIDMQTRGPLAHPSPTLALTHPVTFLNEGEYVPRENN